MAHSYINTNLINYADMHNEHAAAKKHAATGGAMQTCIKIRRFEEHPMPMPEACHF
jgi:hypothetical protein